MVPQSRKDRNYRIPDLLAFQQPVAIQIANIDCTVSEPYVNGKGFIFVQRMDVPEVHELVVVLNWFEELKRN